MTPQKGVLNYTTSIEVAKTLGEIIGILTVQGRGVRGIQTLYDEQSLLTGLVFGILVNGNEVAFKLPANVDAVYAKLKAQYNAGRIRSGFATREQAARVAWRILKDWTEAQVALIETGMVSTEEVFLPYMLTSPDKTLYELMAERQFALPAPQKDR